MGLVACNECGHQVSTDAESCPQCGAVLKQKGSKRSIFGALIVVLIVVGLIAYFSSGGNNGTNTISSGDAQVASAQNQPDAVDYAYALCTMLKKTGDVTQCKVNIRSDGNSVDATIDTSGADARKICSGVASEMAQKTHTFSDKWQLRIFSPYGQEGPIAACTFD
ncbi:MAG TPA: zinc ribbon domain-containing protein [Gammaproteobacteria bacterium]|nr:zinc ribbon domain-containing protein [Gammaproteobacteria bacterium]